MSTSKENDELRVKSIDINENKNIHLSLEEIPLINNIQKLNCSDCNLIKQLPQLSSQTKRVNLVLNHFADLRLLSFV
jgi:hypothetical protein